MRIFISTIFPIIINLLVHHLLAVTAKDVLSQANSTLEPTSTLVSSNEMFTLGFFRMSSTSLTYLGIRFRKKGGYVWVANRDAPMISDGVLMIDGLGTLKVINMNTNTIMFNVTNEVVGSGINTIAVLEDSGNFVLYDNATKNRILWQSFDHPTDTLLPGMRLGYKNLILTSWLNDQIPASGAFTLRMEQIQNSTQLVIYRRGMLYWSSGPWEHGRFRYQSSFNGTLINGTFEVMLMLQLTYTGKITDGIDNYSPFVYKDYCYQGDEFIDPGCATIALPICRHQYDRFFLGSGWDIGGEIENDFSSNISMGDCMERCWNDCNCKGFSTSNINGTGCTTWGGDGPIPPNH